MKKRSLLLCLALVLSLTMAIGGTLAYLTDTEYDTNVMTLGNVDIEQIEVGEDGNPFKDNQLLYPAVVENGNVTGVIHKILSVKNVGKSPAYVRTIVAFPEVGGKSVTLTPAEGAYSPIVPTFAFEVEAIEEIQNAVINGKEYTLFVCTYPAALAPNAETGKSLLSFYMAPEVTNEDLKGFNGEYRVLVASQAMQVENMGTKTAAEALDLGFNDITTTAHPWSAVGVTDPIKMSGDTAGQTLVGDGTTTITSAYHIENNTVNNFIIDAGVASSAAASQVKGDNEFNDCVFLANGTNAFWADGVEDNATITFNNCTFEAGIKLGGDTAKYVFNNCTFKGAVGWPYGLITAYGTIELNNCTFDHSAGAKYDVYKAVGLPTDVITVTGEGEVIVAGKATADDPIVVEVVTKDTLKSMTIVEKQETALPSADVKNTINNAEEGSIVDFSGNTVETEPGQAYALYYPALPSNGTIKNLICNGGAYGMRMDGGITFENCSFTGLHSPNISDGNGAPGKATFINCTFKSWMAFQGGKVTSVEFINCTFGKSSYGFINSRQDMTFINCTFLDEFDGIDDESESQQTWTFTNCTGVDTITLNATGTYTTVTIVQN